MAAGRAVTVFTLLAGELRRFLQVEKAGRIPPDSLWLPPGDVTWMAVTIAAAPSGPSLPVIANGEILARWQTSFASIRPSPAI